jgi:F-type H+-transporting ATPase subunit b
MKLFDWFTVCAQIVNFLILVGLLKHFLYGRILRAIDARERGIAARLAEAEEKVHQAESEKEEFQKRLHELEAASDAMLAQARTDAERKRIELMRQAREEITSIEEHWRRDLERERSVLFEDIRSRFAGEILSVVRRALSDLACCDLNQCAIRVFLNKFATMESRLWKELDGQPIVIRSAFELSEPTRSAMQEALGAQGIRPLSVRFERTDDLGWGVELCANGRKIAWSAEEYVNDLELRLRDALEKKAGEVSRTVAS